MMEYGICTLSTIPVRSESAHKSEMITQLVFGESYELLKITEDREWCFISMSFDNYEGWIPFGMHFQISQTSYNSLKVRAADILNTTLTISCNSKPILASVGSIIPNIPELNVSPIDPSNINSQDSILDLAYQYLNTPYLWGGRSIAGIDCSGFVQKVFQMAQIYLPRDAYQQAEIGNDIEIEAIKPGDLAFFKNKNGRITHVGIMIDSERIIHASHYVRVDYMDKIGIFKQTTKERTHELSHVKRVLLE